MKTTYSLLLYNTSIGYVDFKCYTHILYIDTRSRDGTIYLGVNYTYM